MASQFSESRIALKALECFLFAFAFFVGQTEAAGKAPAALDGKSISAIAALLPEHPSSLAPICSDRVAWGNQQLKTKLAKTLLQAKKLYGESFPEWQDNLYLEFQRNGERLRGQEMMNARRSRLWQLVMAECQEYQGRFIEQIEMALHEIATQKTWVLAAHDSDLKTFRDGRYFVDLHAAELANTVSEALYLLRDKISSDTRAEALKTLEQRIFAPMRISFHSGAGHRWLAATSNWNAVCLNGVIAAALTTLPDRNDRALFVAAAAHYSQNYIAGFSDDGYSNEGMSYWNYGFSRYIEMRERIARATNGKIDLFDNPKTRDIALYGVRMEMFPGNAAAFGDSIWGSTPHRGALVYANKVLGLSLTDFYEDSSSTSLMMLFQRAEPISTAHATDTSGKIGIRTYFDKAGVLVTRPAERSASLLAITIKAGGNSTHSHNDVGSYAIAIGKEQPVGDPGGLSYYSKRSFGAERYESKVLNSYGHPVPVVANQLQKEAAKVQSRVLSTKLTKERDEIVIDMVPAYDVPELKRLKRVMRYERTGNGAIEIEDRFQFKSPQNFEVALITRGKWTRVDENTLEFSSANERLRAIILATDKFDLIEDWVKENGLEFTRIGIRLQHPQTSGAIRVLYSPKR